MRKRAPSPRSSASRSRSTTRSPRSMTQFLVKTFRLLFSDDYPLSRPPPASTVVSTPQADRSHSPAVFEFQEDAVPSINPLENEAVEFPDEPTPSERDRLNEPAAPAVFDSTGPLFAPNILPFFPAVHAFLTVLLFPISQAMPIFLTQVFATSFLTVGYTFGSFTVLGWDSELAGLSVILGSALAGFPAQMMSHYRWSFLPPFVSAPSEEDSKPVEGFFAWDASRYWWIMALVGVAASFYVGLTVVRAVVMRVSNAAGEGGAREYPLYSPLLRAKTVLSDIWHGRVPSQ